MGKEVGDGEGRSRRRERERKKEKVKLMNMHNDMWKPDAVRKTIGLLRLHSGAARHKGTQIFR